MRPCILSAGMEHGNILLAHAMLYLASLAGLGEGSPN